MTPVVTVVAVAALLWLGLFSAWLYLLAAPTRRIRTRKSRRGGYVKPPASRTTNRVTIPAPLEPGTTGYISLRSALGSPSAGGATLAQRVGPSKPTGLGSSGSATGGVGANGQQPHFVVYGDRDRALYNCDGHPERVKEYPGVPGVWYVDSAA